MSLALTAFVIIAHSTKINREDKAFLQSREGLTNWLVKSGKIVLTKDEYENVLIINLHMAREKQISDRDLDYLLSLSQKQMTKDKTGNALVDFFSGLIFQPRLSDNQKRKIGDFCVIVLSTATDESNRVLAVRIIKVCGLKSTNDDLLHFVNDRNPKVSSTVKTFLHTKK